MVSSWASVMSLMAKQAERGAVCAPPAEFGANGLYSDWLLAAHRHGSEPAVAVGLLTAHDGVKLFLDRLGDGANPALADFDLVHGADGSDLRGRAGEEGFVGDVEHFARNHLLDNRDAQVAGDLERRIAGDAGQHGVA